jgi:hypothetical protein
MTYENRAIDIFQSIQIQINSRRFQEKFKRNETDFTRQRKMSMADIMNYILLQNKKNQSIALEKYMKQLKKNATAYSNQAFSKARSKIKPEAFLSLFYSSRDKIMDSVSPKTWYGYRIFAIDGTGLHMPSTNESKAYWGFRSKDAYQALASMSVLTDVRNNIIYDFEITPWRISEKSHAYALIERFSTPNSIIIFDRGYCNSKVIDLLCECNIKFVIRTKEQNYSELHSMDEKKTTNVSGRNFSKERRLTRYTVNSGTSKMYLITNLNDARINNSMSMDELYRLRWGVEGKYYELKNRINIETVSSVTPDNVKQDLYASLIFSNIVAFFKLECDKRIYKKSSHKYKYQANLSELMLRIYDTFSCLLLLHRGIKTRIREIMQQGIKRGSPIRPNRIKERSKSLNISAAKHAHNLKAFI